MTKERFSGRCDVVRETLAKVEALQQQFAGQLAPFDEAFARLLDEVRWPDAHVEKQRPARLLASPWLAHGLMMAMVAGCGGLAPRARDGATSVADATVDAPRIVLPDAPAADTRPREAGSLPQQSCQTDGGQPGSIDGGCDISVLTQEVSKVSGGLICHQSSSPADMAYAVVIDCNGQASELLVVTDQAPLLSGDARQAWLDSLANDRWPCLAGQSVQFTCTICLFP